MSKQIIPEEKLRFFPFNFKYLSIPDNTNQEMKPPLKQSGLIKSIQNQKSEIEIFYKPISKF